MGLKSAAYNQERVIMARLWYVEYMYNVNHELPLSSLMSVFVQRLANSLHLHDPTLITMVTTYTWIFGFSNTLTNIATSGNQFYQPLSVWGKR